MARSSDRTAKATSPSLDSAKEQKAKCKAQFISTSLFCTLVKAKLKMSYVLMLLEVFISFSEARGKA